MTESKKAWYDRRKSNGLCVKCGEKAQPGKVLCEKCAEKRAICQKETIKFRRKMGFCPRCGKNRLYGNEQTCPECLAENMETVKKSRIRTGKTDMDYYRERQEKYKRDGLCRTGCGRKREEGKTYCTICLIKRREKAKKNNRKKDKVGIDRSERPSYGLCYICENTLDRNGKICIKCAEKVTNNLPAKKDNLCWRSENNIVFGKGKGL